MNLQAMNKRIKNLEEKLRKNKIKKSSFSQAERKKRARNLIILGANFEILGYEKEENTVILGFLKENINKIKQNRELYKEIGQSILDERAKTRLENKLEHTSPETRQVNSDEIKELLILSKKYNISEYIKQEFNKTLWEKLTYKEFILIKKNFTGI
jgi:phosphopantetheine adenylyltransferase